MIILLTENDEDRQTLIQNPLFLIQWVLKRRGFIKTEKVKFYIKPIHSKKNSIRIKKKGILIKQILY